jgi:excisionase family DNA binding protein
MYLTLSASPWNEIQPTCEVMRLELDIIFAIEECSPSTTAAGNGKNCRDLPCSEAGFDALAPGRRLATATADGREMPAEPEKPTAIPHLEGKGRESFLDESRGNRVYTRRRGMLPGRKFPGRNGTPMKAQTAGTEQREVMDIRQAADYLGISADTLYKYASEGFVPAFKLGNRWRFKRSRLNDWMDQQSSGGNMPARVPGRSTEERPSRAKAKPVQSVRPTRRKSAAQ